MAFTTLRVVLAACAATLLGMVAPPSALAKPEGEPQPCGNCHYEERGPEISVAFSNDNPATGEKITLTISLMAVHEEAQQTGVMVTTNAQGAFTLVDKTGTRLHTSTQVTHSKPKTFTDGKAEFKFDWTAPNSAGVADFTVWSMSDVNSGKPDEYHHSTMDVSIAHGCEGKNYYPDLDGDGFGDRDKAKLSCEPVPDFIEMGGDCNDEEASINPDATEQCNVIDDNCDGSADEGLDPALYYPDTDGDGYGRGTGKFACNNSEGLAKEKGDCAPDDPDVHPGATEDTGNNIDDDCDGMVDEDDGGQGGNGGSSGSDEDDDVDDVGNDRAAGGCSVSGASTVPAPLLALLGLMLAVGTLRRRR